MGAGHHRFGSAHPHLHHWRLWIILWLAFSLLAFAAIFHWTGFLASHSLTQTAAFHALGWRVQVFARKAAGNLPELTWGDLWLIARQRRGFGLERLTFGLSPEGSISNPFNSEQDLQAAADIFNRKCSICHGAEAAGWSAPALNHAGLRHGDSDLAIYKVLRDGIPGTPMVAPDLTRLQRWQLTAYIRSLMLRPRHRDQQQALDIQVTAADLASAGSFPDRWLTYSGSFDGRRYSPLSQITPANVARLRLRWIRQFDTAEPTIEATPLVVNGVIFTTEPPSGILALDARSGAVLWRYQRSIAPDLSLCCGRINRGLAILGRTLFLEALDGYLVAVDANTGKMIWQTRVADPSDGYSLTAAPILAGNSVVVGVAGGDFGIRGFIAAYDPETGKLRWKFDTVPAPGQFGSDTWHGDSWKTGGGATWTPGSYDPSLGLLYWGVGNPGPDYNGDFRPGDNLFTDSVVALDAATGKLAWYFQFTPHDEHDWDATQTPVLADIPLNGAVRKVLCWANRNGFYYVLDRTNGRFITGVPFVEQNWAAGLDPSGRPILAPSAGASALIRPAFFGGTNWQNPAFDPVRQLFFVHATEGSAVFTKSLDPPKRDTKTPFWGSLGATSEAPTVVLRALDVSTGLKKWEYFSSRPDPRQWYSGSYSGLLATGGGLVFGAAGGSAFALDSSSGRELWRVSLGGDTRAAPISFTVDGRQVVAISAGRSLFLFGL